MALWLSIFSLSHQPLNGDITSTNLLRVSLNKFFALYVTLQQGLEREEMSISCHEFWTLKALFVWRGKKPLQPKGWFTGRKYSYPSHHVTPSLNSLAWHITLLTHGHHSTSAEPSLSSQKKPHNPLHTAFPIPHPSTPLSWSLASLLHPLSKQLTILEALGNQAFCDWLISFTIMLLRLAHPQFAPDHLLFLKGSTPHCVAWPPGMFHPWAEGSFQPCGSSAECCYDRGRQMSLPHFRLFGACRGWNFCIDHLVYICFLKDHQVICHSNTHHLTLQLAHTRFWSFSHWYSFFGFVVTAILRVKQVRLMQASSLLWL